MQLGIIMERQFFPSAILKSRLKEQKNITFLFGSALTMQRDGVGIPGVAGVVEVIKSYIHEKGLSDNYEEFISGKNPQHLYQDSFAYVSAVLGAGAIKEIVTKVVMVNFDHEKQKHRIPAPVIDLIELIESGELNVKNIITTNFDTIIEEQLKNKKILYNSYGIVTDSNIPDADNNNINIFHIHGVWDRGDSMHTRNQLEASRSKIESSMQRLLDNSHVVVMTYGGWEDSFTRTLTNVMNDDKAEYNIAWCFYEKEEGIIDREYNIFFNNLKNAITRERITFFNGIDCTTLFRDLLGIQNPVQEIQADIQNPIQKINLDINSKTIENPNSKQSIEINFYTPEARPYYKYIRIQEQRIAKQLLKEHRAVFIESGIGSGFFGFISSLTYQFFECKVNFIRIDMTDVISKKETENRIHAQTGFSLNQLIYMLSIDRNQAFVITFDNIRANADDEALKYLLHLSDFVKQLTTNVFIILSSGAKIKIFNNIHLKLNALTWHETMLILQTQFDPSRFQQSDYTEIHDRSEGVIGKLERIMYFLEDSSTEEVLEQDNILDNDFYNESIPSTMLKQIELLSTSPDKTKTFKMLKLLSVLKNGETLKNLRKSSLGLDLTPNNTKELINLELATSVYIDSSTVIIKVNQIIKDYVLSCMLPEEIYHISQEYLNHTIVEGKDGINISSVNRKIYDIGYQAEEDNANTLLRINITECKNLIASLLPGDPNINRSETRLRKLLYLSHAYVYSLENSSRFNELIIAANNILNLIRDVKADDMYKYYFYIAYAYRMKGNTSESWKYLNLSKDSCPATDKAMISRLYVEELYILENKDVSEAINLAKLRKNEFKRDYSAFIVSECILSLAKPRNERVGLLVRLEKKARKHGLHTLANNILFELARSYDSAHKISASKTIIQTDNSNYNIARAVILKFETIIESGAFDQISERDVTTIVQVYNYLFSQQFDNLFNRCYDVLRAVVKSKNQSVIITEIFFKAIIMWKLNFNDGNEKKYNELIGSDVISDEQLTV
jgi:hypothetical protein